LGLFYFIWVFFFFFFFWVWGFKNGEKKIEREKTGHGETKKLAIYGETKSFDGADDEQIFFFLNNF
jgi:hypothetical protein